MRFFQRKAPSLGKKELSFGRLHAVEDFFRETWPQMQEVLDSILAASDKPFEELAELTVPSDEDLSPLHEARDSFARQGFLFTQTLQTEAG